MKLPLVVFELFAGKGPDDPERRIHAFLASEEDARTFAAPALELHRGGRLLKPNEEDPHEIIQMSRESTVAWTPRRMVADLPFDSIEAARAAGFTIDDAALVEAWSKDQPKGDTPDTPEAEEVP